MATETAAVPPVATGTRITVGVMNGSVTPNF
jgi:hypothetical protein